MKITQNTLDILKNFSTINPTLYVAPGDVIRTVSQNKTVLAEARVDETFPQEFAIYDLSEFLGVSSLFDEPEMDFEEHYVRIHDGDKSSSSYFYAEKAMVTIPPSNGINLPDEPIQFRLDEKVLKRILQAASVMGLPEVIVRGDRGTVSVLATNSKNSTSHVFSYEVGETEDTFDMVFKVDNLKMISDSYDVTISSKGIARFTSVDGSLSYWVATEGTSTYG